MVLGKCHSEIGIVIGDWSGLSIVRGPVTGALRWPTPSDTTHNRSLIKLSIKRDCDLHNERQYTSPTKLQGVCLLVCASMMLAYVSDRVCVCDCVCVCVFVCVLVIPFFLWSSPANSGPCAD